VNNYLLHSLVALVALATSAVFTPTSAGQTATPPAKTLTTPRTPAGRPDFQGFWHIRREGIMPTYSIEEGASEEHAKVAGQALGRGNPIIVDPADGKVPYQPWALARRNFLAEQHLNPTKPEYLDPDARCILAGIRLQWEPQQYQIFQPTDGSIWIFYELTHAYRIISVDGRPPLGEDIKLYMGDSRGHWEGDTLVIESSNYNDKTWFDVVGNFHSDALRVTERWTFIDSDTIHFEATINDPKVLTRTLKLAYPIERIKDTGYELLEHACYEGEHDSVNILRESNK
jgi:hypothetical protein